MIAWTIYFSLATAAALAVLPSRDPRLPRVVALAGALAGWVAGVLGALNHPGGERWVDVVRLPWIRELGAEYHLAADGITLTLVILTGLASVAGVLFSWEVEARPRGFFGLYMLLIAGVYGVFLSADLLLFFVFYEIAIIPKYFLIAIWGSTQREHGAMKLALYSFVGSALVLVGIIAAYAVSGATDFDMLRLAQYRFSPGFQAWVFPVSFLGFAILAGLWPFHSWAPTGHVAAPTAGSMLLAGVVMKLGAYGCLRVAMAMFPAGLIEWQPAVAGLAVVGIVYGALIALTHRDFKFVVGYSSVSHMGFVLLGLASATTVGLNGAVLQMFSHGVIAGLLFGVVGRMVYAREHTRDLDELSVRNLSESLPFAAILFVIAGLASMGMPGFSGFVAELKILMGAWQRFPAMTLAAGLGVVLGAAYTLRAIQKAFFGGDSDAAPAGIPGAGAPPAHAAVEPITAPEKIGALMLVAATVVIGLYPRLLLDWIGPGIESGIYFEALRKGALP